MKQQIAHYRFIAAPARERKGKEKFGRLSIEEAVNAHLFLIFAYPHPLCMGAEE